MATRRAILTGIRGIHRHKLATGPCCLVRQQGGELTPRRIMDAFREAMVVRHPVDREVFDRNQIKAVNDTAALLVSEIAAPPGNPFMDTGYHLAAFGAFRRALL